MKTRENWQKTHTKRRNSFSKNVHAFFMNMIAEKLWNKNFYAWRFGFDFDKISWSFRILTIVRLCFSNVFGRFFRLIIVSLLSLWRENQSGQLHFTAGSCVSGRAGCKKSARSERFLSQSDCFIFTDKK